MCVNEVVIVPRQGVCVKVAFLKLVVTWLFLTTFNGAASFFFSLFGNVECIYFFFLV